MAKRTKKDSVAVNIIPLGGVDGIGMNITAFECGEDIIIVDCGVAFPEDNMPGVDLVIPDITYLIKNAQKIRGLILTHGHEDHIGAVPYLLSKLDIDVYATRLTLGILDGKLSEHKLKTEELFEIRAGETLTLGAFEVEFINVNHSMPDAVALCITTPCGRILHTGDFKVDFTPIGNKPIDLGRFAELGKKGIRLLMCDSTNAERPGYTPSESTLSVSFDRIFNRTDKRIVIATFSSNVHRVQQILTASGKCGRKVAVTGRSMLNVLNAADKLGYIDIPDDMLIELSDMKHFPPEKLTLLTTGSQGEPMSALYRMAFGEHNLVNLGPTDIVVISASAIPGNEKMITKIINELYKRGVEVITDSTDDVHVSGHACREELKLMQALTRPECFMPIHGEYKHLVHNKNIALAMGIPEKNIILPEAGRIIELTKQDFRVGGTVEAGKILVDGSGVGDVGSSVLRDRMHLAEDGIIILSASVDFEAGMLVYGPEIVSKGFVYVKENEALLSELTELVERSIEKNIDKCADLPSLRARVREELASAVSQRTKRKPMILPLINAITI